MKILVCGLCPLPFENRRQSFGPGVRTWQFACALRDAGHEVQVVARRILRIYPPETPEVESFDTDGIAVTAADWSIVDEVGLLRGVARRFRPDAVVGATMHGSFDACRLDPPVPVWVDHFGDVMAEAQAKASIEGDNRYLRQFWSKAVLTLLRGDVFSSVSNHQKFAVIGELGAIGRLTAETAGYEFVHTIPCGLDPTPLTHRETVLRGTRVPEDAFVVLWSGGYNVWADVDTLFAGLERAMRQNRHIHFVSTGGEIDGQDEVTYPRFRRMVEGSSHRDRYLLLGWRPKREVTDYYFEADVGINVDRYIYEGLLGSKNRILDWMRAGLPALAAELPELTRTLRDERIGFVFPLGDEEALGDALLGLAADRRRLRDTGERARAYGRRFLTFGATAQPLVDWCAAPLEAPDSGRQRKARFLKELDAARESVPVGLVSRTYEAIKPVLDRLGLGWTVRRLRPWRPRVGEDA